MNRSQNVVRLSFHIGLVKRNGEDIGQCDESNCSIESHEDRTIRCDT